MDSSSQRSRHKSWHKWLVFQVTSRGSWVKNFCYYSRPEKCSSFLHVHFFFYRLIFLSSFRLSVQLNTKYREFLYTPDSTHYMSYYNYFIRKYFAFCPQTWDIISGKEEWKKTGNLPDSHMLKLELCSLNMSFIHYYTRLWQELKVKF